MSATQRPTGGSQWPALLSILYGLAVTVYILLRYGLRWGDSDTLQIVQAARAVFSQGTISPSGGAYPHGFAYQALITALARVSGIGVMRVDLVVLPFISVGVALAAFVAFRILTGSALLGGIAALLLFIQPEFVFVIERGSHEKTTLTYVLLLLFLLTATLTRGGSGGVVVSYVVVFYVIAWALIATNSFFGSSFFFSLALALAGGALVLWRTRSPHSERALLNRMLYTVLSGAALVFMFVAYVYAPARSNYGTLRTLIDRLSALFLSFEVQSNPYASIGSATGAAWIAPWVYLLLASFDMFMVVCGFAVWVWLAIRFLRTGVGRADYHHLLLWLFAAAFALEVVISAVVDLSGFLGNNLQIRLFPLFMLAAIPLVVVGAAKLAGRVRHRGQTSMAIAGVLLLMTFDVTGILKATNDPLVSNKWLFYTSDEQAALTWTDRDLSHQSVWAGFDERLQVMQALQNLDSPVQGNRYMAGGIDESARYVIMSDVIRQRSLRLNVPAPDVVPDDRVYDNGGAQLYHLVPQTPYQP